MSRWNDSWKTLILWGGVALLLVDALRLAEAQIGVGTNLRLADPNGPDGTPETLDDEPRRHIEPAIAVHPLEPGKPLAAWIEWQYPVVVDEELIGVTTIGFNEFDVSSAEPWMNHDVIWENAHVEPLHGFQWGGAQVDPGTAIGGNGYRYMVGLHASGLPQPLIFMRKTDSDPNTPWTLARFAYTGDPNCPSEGIGHADKPLVTADPTLDSVDPVRAKRVFVQWTQGKALPTGDARQIRFICDEEGADRFADPNTPAPSICETTVIAETNDADPPEPPEEHSYKYGATSAVGPDGQDHVAWLDMRDFQNGEDGDIRYRKLIPSGAPCEEWAWDPPIGPEPEDYQKSRLVAEIDDVAAGPTFVAMNIEWNRLHSLPSIAVDWGAHNDCTGRKGWVYVVYASEVTGPPAILADIFCVRSRDNGTTWDPPVKVNDDTDPEGTIVQIMPWVVVDHMGRVIVMWLDFREDALENRKYHIYMAVSLDGGYTFSENVPVTEVPSDTAFVGTVFIGDYNYMAVEPDPQEPEASRAFPIWADLRNREEQGADHDTAGDIYYAPVTVTGDLIRHPDLDGDGDVDLTDFSIFQLCFGGSNNPPAPTCPEGVNSDFDCDGDVDLADFLIFQQYYTGSGSESQSSLGPDDLDVMVSWCEDNLSRTQRIGFAQVLRDGVRRRPNAPDASMAAALAEAIDPRR